MCIRDRSLSFLFIQKGARKNQNPSKGDYSAYYLNLNYLEVPVLITYTPVSYTHLRAHETVLDLVCRLLLAKKKKQTNNKKKKNYNKVIAHQHDAFY